MSDEIKTDLTCPDCKTRTPAPMNEQGTAFARADTGLAPPIFAPS